MRRRIVTATLALLAVAGSAWSCAEATTPAPRSGHGHSMAAGPVSDHANGKTKAFGEQFWKVS